MSFFADLHVHSKYSRATSRDCDLEHLAWWAQRKGITVVGTGDFTHPAWWQEIRDKLVPAEPGLYKLRPEIARAVRKTLPASCHGTMRFLLEVEISTIYKKGDKTRKVHHLIYAASMETASRFRDRLGAIGNIRSDGRPILGLDSRDLLEITLEAGPDAYLVPAHIWTPWFAAMGSKSGFDSIDACYGDLAEHIFAVETGLSSDPPMNWRVSHLDRFTLVSNSDAHSPPMLGREACVFDCDLDYFAMRRALETGIGYGGTVEFFPEEGKYHLDGHRACQMRLGPQETRAHGGRCPVCGKPVTVGVMHRVERLADRPDGERPAGTAPYRSLVPLPEIAGEIHGCGPKTKTVARTLDLLTDRLGSEFRILFEQPVEDITRATHPLIGEAIRRLRAGTVHAEGGYDGEFGTVRLFEPDEIVRQMSLFAFAPPKVEPRKPPSAASLAEATGATTDDATPASSAALPDPAQPSRGANDGSLLGRLDPDQRAAAEVTEGALLIVAGPGSGKTRTLTHRIAHLIERGEDAASCLAITFTRRAADEMRERLDALLTRTRATESASRPLVTTFHGLGLRILREHHAAIGLDRDFSLADEATRLAIVGELFGLKGARASQELQALDTHRAAASSEEDGREAEPPPAKTAALDQRLAQFRAALFARDQVDFGELIVRPIELLEADESLCRAYQQRWRHVSIDEYQDIDALQYRFVRLLTPATADPCNGSEHEVAATPGRSVCAIGDPDQSIYAFRGADVSFFLRFQQDQPAARVIELVRNYRSQPAVVRAAAAMIRPTSLVPDRRTEPVSPLLSRPVAVHRAASPRAEAEFVVHTIERLLGGTSHFSLDSGRVRGEDETEPLSFGDIALLYRTRSQAVPLVEALERAGMPYQERSHQRLAARDDVRLLLHEAETAGIEPDRPALEVLEAAALRLGAVAGVGGHDLPTAEETPADSDGDAETSDASLAAGLELLAPLARSAGTDWATFRAQLALGAEVDTWDPRAERITLLTLHAAKGLEFPVVFLVGCEEGLLPFRLADGSGDQAEERRLFFVGMTRAERALYLTWCQKRSVRGQANERQRTSFLETIDPNDLALVANTHKPTSKKAKPAEQLRLL